MKRLSRSLVLAALLVSIATTALAAPQRDDSGSWWSKIVKTVKRIVTPLDDMSIPKP